MVFFITLFEYPFPLVNPMFPSTNYTITVKLNEPAQLLSITYRLLGYNKHQRQMTSIRPNPLYTYTAQGNQVWAKKSPSPRKKMYFTCAFCFYPGNSRFKLTPPPPTKKKYLLQLYKNICIRNILDWNFPEKL